MDGGSGLRALGKEIIESNLTGLTFHIFLSHLHYDHIQGIPFFAPAYFPSNSVVFHGGHRDIEKFLRRQMEEPFFQLTLTPWGQIFLSKNIPLVIWSKYAMRKSLFLNRITRGIPTDIGWEANGKALVYSTDCEHKNEAHGKDYPYLDFIRNADLLIFDAALHPQSIDR